MAVRGYAAGMLTCTKCKGYPSEHTIKGPKVHPFVMREESNATPQR